MRTVIKTLKPARTLLAIPNSGEGGKFCLPAYEIHDLFKAKQTLSYCGIVVLYNSECKIQYIGHCLDSVFDLIREKASEKTKLFSVIPTYDEVSGDAIPESLIIKMKNNLINSFNIFNQHKVRKASHFCEMQSN